MFFVFDIFFRFSCIVCLCVSSCIVSLFFLFAEVTTYIYVFHLRARIRFFPSTPLISALVALHAIAHTAITSIPRCTALKSPLDSHLGHSPRGRGGSPAIKRQMRSTPPVAAKPCPQTLRTIRSSKLAIFSGVSLKLKCLFFR